MSLPLQANFQQSVRQQIAVNRARTPTERLCALCDLLDASRALAPLTAQAAERRRRVLAVRQQQREQFRDQCRRWAAAERTNPPAGL